MARFGSIGTQYFGNEGEPLSGGSITFYESGTTALKDTYSDVEESIENTNPVVLDAFGRQPNIFFSGSAKAVLKTAAGVIIETRDPVGDAASRVAFSSYSALITYSINDLVIGPDALYYRSLQNANTGNIPASSPAYWQLFTFLPINATEAGRLDVLAGLTPTANTVLRGDGTNWAASAQVALRDAANTFTEAQTISGASPTLQLIETDTTTNASFLLGGGIAYIAIGAAGSGGSGSGTMRISGGGTTTDLAAFQVRWGSAWCDVWHAGNVPDVSQAEAEAGSGTSRRAWTPQRVAQASAKHGGLVLLATASASGNAAIDFTGLNSDFDEYEIHLLNVIPSLTGGAGLMVRTSSDNGATFDATSGNYAYAGTAADQWISLNASVSDSATSSGASGVVRIIRPAAANYTAVASALFFSASTSENLVAASQFGRRVSATPVNAVRFLFSSSSNIASGLFKLYGLRKSV